MAIVAGIDEAGFGPTLGPLVVTGVAFQVPEQDLTQSLWKILQASCTGKKTRGDGRLVICDSKVLYRSGGGLSALERTALVMLAAAGHRPGSWRELLQLVAVHAVDQLEKYPWYRNANVPLPMTAGVGDIATQANAVRSDCTGRGIGLGQVYSEPLAEGHFNRLVEQTRNKSVLLLWLVLRVLQRILCAYPRERVHVHVDRLGGRTSYREALLTGFSGYSLTVLAETEDRSAYRLVRGPEVCEIDFVTGGEARHLPIALASVYSKYQRELYMRAFNQYWLGRMAHVRPTAGYYTDAARWLHEMSPELNRLRIDRELLIRRR